MVTKAKQFFLSPAFLGLFFLVSIVFRRLSLPAMSLDMEAGLFGWYGFILKKGFVNAFKENFALYTPAYLYLLWLATLVNGLVSRVTLIKLISIFFDLVSSIYLYKITWLKYPKTRVPLLAAILGFSLPTVILNSSYWGQCDSIYTAFFLACLYYVLIERPLWAVFCFSIAFAFKLQAIFICPFLAVYTLRKRIPLLSFLLVPLTYILFALPTIIAGRPWWDVFTIYLHQTEKFPKWSSTTPTMYLPLQGRVPLTSILSLLAVILAAVIVIIWIYSAWKQQKKDGYGSIILTSMASVALVPFILPRMHQRYFYPQDVISLLVAFFFPKLWFLPVLSQVISILSYGPFLFNTNFQIHLFGLNLNAILYLALPLEILVLGVTLWSQFRIRKGENVQENFSN